MEKFNKIFSEIRRLNKIDPASAEARLGKLAEEFGELAKEVNKTNGRKVLKPGDTMESIRNEIRDEAADTIQNVISLIDGFGISASELLEAMIRKNKSWATKIKEKKRGPGVTGVAINKTQKTKRKKSESSIKINNKAEPIVGSKKTKKKK